MRLLVDTNVILDMIFRRDGCDVSMELFRKIKENGDHAYITASTVTDLFYIIHRELHDTGQTYIAMENIFKLTEVFPVTEKDIKEAFRRKWKDFEDCVQYVVGEHNGADCIITGNRKDYEDVSLPVQTPVGWIEETGGMKKK